MTFRLALFAFPLVFVSALSSQWQSQDSPTKAGLRGIHAVNQTIAWASGTDGTILRTTDGGAHWTKCAVPPDGEKLDFRAIWAWNDQDAYVMSAGPGEQSRVYSTADGCAHWKQDRRNDEKDGFWDAMVFQTGDFGFAIGDEKTGVLIGDPVGGHFATEVMLLGHGWFVDGSACSARQDEAAFAASNSSVFVFGSRRFVLGTGGKAGPRVLLSPLLAYNDQNRQCLPADAPLAGGTASSGVFSVHFRDLKHGMAVGGDYEKPESSQGTAAWTSDGGRTWIAATKPPHGYRSAVAWDEAGKVWISAGTNGSDVSHDDGKTWEPLDNGNWNALSLPFAVGPNGRIGKLQQVKPLTSQ